MVASQLNSRLGCINPGLTFRFDQGEIHHGTLGHIFGQSSPQGPKGDSPAAEHWCTKKFKMEVKKNMAAGKKGSQYSLFLIDVLDIFG